MSIWLAEMTKERAALMRILWVAKFDSEPYRIAREALMDVQPASTRAAAPPPAVSPRPCPSCGCGSPAHTVDCEQADAA